MIRPALSFRLISRSQRAIAAKHLVRLLALCAFVFVAIGSQSPSAFAQRPVARAPVVRAPAVPRAVPPRVAPPRATVPHAGGVGRPISIGSPRTGIIGGRPFGFRPRPFVGPIFFFPFFNQQFFWSEEAFSFFAPVCGVVIGAGWAPGGDSSCSPVSVTPSPPPPNYVLRPSYELPEYYYDLEGPPLIWLYLKDGTVFGVSDYWFVNDEVHFRMSDEAVARSVEGENRYEQPREHVISFDQLDVETTVRVNSARGFRVVRRPEPLELYLRDHPNESPPDLEPPHEPQKR
jgi:hypothetical protein